ncbi:MAG: tRNA (adenosine(37)-N6)-threonylcarbamoyltransferase complex transferase subunit TsaD [Planctomycetota bacterium]
MSSSPSQSSGLVLGIESSCDETAAAVVREGKEILSSVVHSQVAEHAVWGGVVPEIAGRSHLKKVLPVIDAALDEASCSLEDLEGIAVTAKPGLIGSLLVGLSTAKALSWTAGLPLVAVDHVEAHVYSATMERDVAPYPCVALVVSGGHTALYRAHSPLEIERIATTLDDAAGEAFDKVASLLGLPYPGGPSLSKLAAEGDRKAVAFPRYRPKKGGLGFSFSGLKTAVLYHLRGGNALNPTPDPREMEDRAGVAASFEDAVVDALCEQTLRAAESCAASHVLVSGGVACNSWLREELGRRTAERGIEAYFPSPTYCTDNGAMIAGLGWHQLRAGQVAGLDVDARPR